MVTELSKEESEQLLRTVEMFEAIVQSQPDDFQSLEILKEAYAKLHRPEDIRRISTRLARAYAVIGQISQAILEYEGIIQQFPDDDETRAALHQLESKTQQLTQKSTHGVRSESSDSKPATPAPAVTAGAGAPRPAAVSQDASAGDRILADVLIADKLLTPQSLLPLLQHLKEQRPDAAKKGQPLTLLQSLAEQQLAKLDDLLVVLVNKSGCPYLPLSIYDVDRDVACLVPRELAFSHCLVPFDLIGRSALIATANPFDIAIRDHVQSLLSYSVFWFVSSPADIATALRTVHGFEGKRPKPLAPS